MGALVVREAAIQAGQISIPSSNGNGQHRPHPKSHRSRRRARKLRRQSAAYRPLNGGTVPAIRVINSGYPRGLKLRLLRHSEAGFVRLEEADDSRYYDLKSCNPAGFNPHDPIVWAWWLGLHADIRAQLVAMSHALNSLDKELMTKKAPDLLRGIRQF